MLSTLPSLRAALAAALSLAALALVPAVASADATVSATDANVFAPSEVTIQAGQKVTWNITGGFHNVFILPDGAPIPAPPIPGQPDLPTGSSGTVTRTFGTAGTFRFLCSIHLSTMTGTVTVTPGTTPPPPPPDTAPAPAEQVAFTSDRASKGSQDIFSIKGDLGNAARLTANLSSDDSAPAFSPDGARIAFQSNRDAQTPSDAHIFAMNADGSDETNLTPGSLARNASPDWSPDGTKIAFSSDRIVNGDDSGNTDIYVMDADGSGVRKLTTEPSDDLEPTWSRDGRRIAFTSDREGGKRNLWTIEVDPEGAGPGKNPTQVASGTFGITGPAFSPTSNQLAYAKARSTAPDFDICITDLDAAPLAERCLTFETLPDQDPAWSPDGRQILFTRDTAGERDLFVLRADTPESERPVTAPGDGSRFQQPAWSSVVNAPPPAGNGPAPAPTPAPVPSGGGAEPDDTRPDPGTAGDPGAFLGLDQPHRTRVKAFRRLGIVVTARCVGVERGTVKLAVAAGLARRLGLKKTTLASAPARCGADRRASALLKPGAKVRKLLATAKARRAIARADGLKTTVTIALSGGGTRVRTALPVLIRS